MPTDRFLDQRLARVAPGQLAERDAADDDGQRLRGRVAAHAGHDRHEHRQRRDPLDGALEERHDRGGQKRGHQVDAQPRQPLAQRLARRRERALVAGHAGQTIDVLGRLVLDDVDDVVHGDDADQLVLFVDDRNGEQVVGRDLPRHFLLVHVDARADQIGGHDPLERRFRRHEQQPAQRRHADQVAPFVDDVEIEHHLDVAVASGAR